MGQGKIAPPRVPLGECMLQVCEKNLHPGTTPGNVASLFSATVSTPQGSVQLLLIDTFVAVGWQQQVVRKHHHHRWMPPTLKKAGTLLLPPLFSSMARLFWAISVVVGHFGAFLDPQHYLGEPWARLPHFLKAVWCQTPFFDIVFMDSVHFHFRFQYRYFSGLF